MTTTTKTREKTMRRTMLALAAIPAMIAGCSGKDEKAAVANSTAAPAGHFEVISSIPKTTDPVQKRKENQAIMDRMMMDMSVPTDNIPGEAFRRDIKIDPAALAARAAKEKAAGGPSKTPMRLPDPGVEQAPLGNDQAVGNTQ